MGTAPCPLPLGDGRQSGSYQTAAPPPPAANRHWPWANAGLLVLTLLSMAIAGAMQQGVNPLAGGPRALVHLVEGLPFAAALAAVLAAHEFGHYIAARRWGLCVSLPYFLPLPFVSFLGTLGAVIRLRSAIPHRRALLDIGAAGPLAGLLVALAACGVGLHQAQVVDTDYFRPDAPIRLGSSLLFSALARLFGPQAGDGQLVLLSPVAFAGWVGLFITAFNLLPIGQLDGGHVVYALFGRAHAWVARACFAVLLGLGLYGILSVFRDWPAGWPGWLALAFLVLLLGRDHPAPRDEQVALNPARRFAGYACLAVFALCITPVPFAYAGP